MRNIKVIILACILTLGGAMLTAEPVFLSPDADATVRGGKFENINLGHKEQLVTADYETPYTTIESFIRFNLETINRPVEKAVLRLFAQKANQGQAFAQYVMDDSWEEDRITFLNAPPAGELVADWWVNTRPLEIDVTPVVQGELALDKILSLKITSDFKYTEYFSKEFCITEKRPALILYLHENTPPQALDQFETTLQNQPVDIHLQAFDPENDFLSYHLAAVPLHGTLDTIGPDVVYFPFDGFTGTDQFTYYVNDGEFDSGTATVTIDVISKDLKILDITLLSVVVNSVTLAVTGETEITFTNGGDINITDPFDIAVVEEGDQANVLGETRITTALAPGETQTLTIPIQGYVKFNGSLFTGFVDAGEEIVESDESNNKKNNKTDCVNIPPSGLFDPALEWEWTGSSSLPSHNQVMCAPVAGNLNDDNGDGQINTDDVPDIVFNTFAGSNYTTDGVLRVISGNGSGELVTIENYRTDPGAQPAIGDIDGDGIMEIIVLDQNRRNILAFENDGTYKWTSADMGRAAAIIASPAIADLNGDGAPEILIGNIALDNTGAILWTGSGGIGRDNSISLDLDLDGIPEVVAGNTAYTNGGDILWQNPLTGDGYTAAGNFNTDPFPEIVVISQGMISLLDHTGVIIWGPTDFVPTGTSRDHGGPPTVADFDNDGEAEIGLAGGYNYVVMDTDGTLLWAQPTRDLSSNQTGSSVFDFDGDGSSEVVYSDEQYLRIYRGSDGTVLYQTYIGSGTLLELPLILDVDNDNNAEIVVASNSYAYGGSTGIQVFGDLNDTWVNTRRIWNQMSYHVTNINEDGTVPLLEENSWDLFNTYRCNNSKEALACEDYTASYLRIVQLQESGTEITVRVGNGGALQLRQNLNVSFYADNVLLGTTQTTLFLAPGNYEDVSMSFASLPTGITGITAVVDDDGTGHGQIREIDELNNRTTSEL